MKAKNYSFLVQHAGEKSAGIHPYHDVIHVTVQSGDVGMEPEFLEIMTSALKEYYDGASVSNITSP